MSSVRLPLDQRRAQIIEAVLPVVIEHGVLVTSKQLAEAAGVSEGTIFKAFGTKEDLLLAVVRADAERDDEVAAWLTSGAADGIELDSLVAQIAKIAVAQSVQSFALFQALGALVKAPTDDEIERFDAALVPWITALSQHEDELTVSPEAAASMLRMLVFSAASGSSWSEGGWGVALDPLDVARVFLYGVRATRTS